MEGRPDTDTGPSRRGLPLGLLGAVVLIVAAETAVFGPHDAPASFIAASWREAHRAAGQEAAAAGGGLLCFGDSQVKAGLLPAVLAQRLGRPAYNLAVVGGQPAASEALLRRALRAGARPSALVVGYYPGLLASDLRINTGLWPEVLGLRGCLALIVETADTRNAGPLLARAVLPSLRRREDIHAAILAALPGGTNASRDEARAFRRNWRVNAGAHALPAGHAYSDDPRLIEHGDRWECRPEHVRSIRRFLALAASREVPVFWVLPTSAPGLAGARLSDGRDAAYDRFLTQLQAGFPGLTVIDPRRALIDPSAFSDACHLDRDGAGALSLAMADALSGPLSSPGASRRLILPAAAVSTRIGQNWALEDVGQSAVALRERRPETVATAPAAMRR